MELGKHMDVDKLLNPLLEETKMPNYQPTPASDARRTVIPAPKTDAMFAGWGVKL
jgi:hypothetical protein